MYAVQPWEYSPGTAAPERRRKLKIGAMAVRTAYLDREVMGHLSRQPAGAAQQVVNLGAGLDTRPWRLDLPEGMHNGATANQNTPGLKNGQANMKLILKLVEVSAISMRLCDARRLDKPRTGP